MSSNPLLDFSWWGLSLQLESAVVITAFVAVAPAVLCAGRGILRPSLLVAEGVIGGLGVMTAATLLRTIGLRTWHQILMSAHTLTTHPPEEAIRVGEAAAV